MQKFLFKRIYISSYCNRYKSKTGIAYSTKSKEPNLMTLEFDYKINDRTVFEFKGM